MVSHPFIAPLFNTKVISLELSLYNSVIRIIYFMNIFQNPFAGFTEIVGKVNTEGKAVKRDMHLNEIILETNSSLLFECGFII